VRIFTLALIAAAALLPADGFTQEADSGPTFEIATVKPADLMVQDRLGIGLSTYPGGRIVANKCPLDYLIEQAFDLQRFQISGAPGWVHVERFNIEAKPPASSQSSHSNPDNPKLPPNEEQRQMLQALLVDRFHLKYAMESKEGPVYFLVKTNRELKLSEAKDKNEYPWAGSVAGGKISGDGLRGTNITMAQLSERLSQYMGRPVVNQTGLTAAYDFKFEYHGDETTNDLISTILTSVQALGLKLETGIGPVKTMVIQSVEKLAAAN
jgi:uncharacterized protein (TIGR03435 family)